MNTHIIIVIINTINFSKFMESSIIFASITIFSIIVTFDSYSCFNIKIIVTKIIKLIECLHTFLLSFSAIFRPTFPLKTAPNLMNKRT